MGGLWLGAEWRAAGGVAVAGAYGGVGVGRRLGLLNALAAMVKESGTS